MAADKTSVVSAVKKTATAATSAAVSDISIPSTTAWVALKAPPGRRRLQYMIYIELSDVVAGVAAAAAFLSAATTGV